MGCFGPLACMFWTYSYISEFCCFFLYRDRFLASISLHIHSVLSLHFFVYAIVLSVSTFNIGLLFNMFTCIFNINLNILAAVFYVTPLFYARILAEHVTDL